MIEIPYKLRKEIQDQIIINSLRGEKGWRFGQRDEDSLLGDYLGNLRTDKRIFMDGNKSYEWESLYHKIQGKGKNAYEKLIGADAIITFEITNNTNYEKTVKSLIFQAKKEGNTNGLQDQKAKMDIIAPRGNFILTCGGNGYTAQTKIGGEKTKIGNFLANKFIECEIGIEGFEYNEKNHTIINKGFYINQIYLDQLKIKI